MYDVYAIRYATFRERTAQENFLQRDVHDGSMPLDYFVWLVKSDSRIVLVDTGFNCAAGERRNRHTTIAPDVALAKIGLQPSAITDVVVTHLHYDHAGNLDKFPNARFHIQEREMAYATGRCMCHTYLRHPFDVDPIIQMVRFVYSGRVEFHSGRSELFPGIELHWVGGHSDGLQIVRVKTARGHVVLASDAAHFYENMLRQNPFPLVYNVGDMIEGWRTVSNLAAGNSCIIPGHDPAVAKLFRQVPADGVDMYALHQAPIGAAWDAFNNETIANSGQLTLEHR